MTYRYFPTFGVRVLQLVALSEAFFRGLTYILIPKQGTAILTDIEQSAPMQTWGIAFMSFAILGFFGEALMSGTQPRFGGNPRAWPSFIAHAGLMILYTTLMLAYMQASFHGKPVLAQAAAAMFVFAFVHWLFARRRVQHAA